MQSEMPGVLFRTMTKYSDSRGWLMELMRDDELPEGFEPVMGYLSVTRPGVARGPHEHVHQTDGFAFLSGTFRLVLWENRPGNPACREEFLVGEEAPVFVTVPPGVVHAYQNVSDGDAFVLNFPDRLYAGHGKKEPVDEIRHEEIDSEFKL